MSTKSIEQTHGSELYRLQKAIYQIVLIPNYNPFNAQDGLTELQLLEQTLMQVTQAEAAKESNYRLSTKERQKAFKEDDYSLEKMLKYIRSGIESQYGKNANETKMIAGYIRKIRGTSPKSKKSETIGAASLESVETVSQSHRSYASLIFAFRNLLSKVSTLQYNTNRPEMQIIQLQVFAQHLGTLNQTVETNLVELTNLRSQRDALFDDVKMRLNRIKNYIRLEFGADSSAYKAIKGI